MALGVVAVVVLSGSGAAAPTIDESPATVTAATQSDRDVPAQVAALLPLVDAVLGTSGPAPRIRLDGADDAIAGSGLAAVTVAASRPGEAARLVVDPAAIAAASPIAVRTLLAHELVHVRLQPSTTPGTPLWVVEGFADLIGFEVAQAPTEAMFRAAATAGAVHELPGDALFVAPGAARDAAYAQALTWWRTLADLTDIATCRGVYAALSTSGPDADVLAALQGSAAPSAAEVQARWLERIGGAGA